MSFFDIVLDFIFMDVFEDLENFLVLVFVVLWNCWLLDSFKEMVLVIVCWLVLKVKRRLLMVFDGFIFYFYFVLEYVSFVLVFGFFGFKF